MKDTNVNLGVVSDLFVRNSVGGAVFPTVKLVLNTGLGIAGDANYSPISPVHALIAFGADLECSGLKPGDLRENITLSGSGAGVHTGHVIAVGGVLLRILLPNGPCKKVCPHVKKNRGMFAVVAHGGSLVAGDAARLVSKQHWDLSSRYDMLVRVLRQVPAGKVVTYRQLIEGIGGTEAHFRTLPGLIRKARLCHPDLPFHRIVDSRFLAVSNDAMCINLRAIEGIQTGKSEVDSKHRWEPARGLHME